MEYVLLIVGFVLLIKGADFFVDGSSSVAKILKVPSIIIGLTVVACGTSLPELSVSLTSALQGNNALAVSNVLGSNIFNILVVLGCCALVTPVKAQLSLLKREFPFSILISVVLLLIISDFSITKVMSGTGTFSLGRYGAALLLVLFVVFVYASVKMALQARKEEEAIEEELEDEYKIMSPLKSAIYVGIGVVGIAIGGDLVVDSATIIAENFGMSQTFIGLTIVAMGTSLPELATSMVAAGKKETDLAIGNAVGSNIFNILLILGVSGVITPISVDILAIYDTLILIAVSLVCYVAAVGKREIKRTEGLLFLVMYMAFFLYILAR